MARPQTAYTAKPAKERNTAADKMRMNYNRMRLDIQRIKAEQAKAEMAEAPKSRR